MSLANRVSLNIEAATKDGLSEITSTKDYNKDILKRLDWMNDIAKKNPGFAKSGHTTQLIVGANDETDLEILKRMESLYKKVDLRRSYFSAFSPVEGTEFEKKESCNTNRTAKLYHADALLSDYKFDVKELVFDENDKLYLNEDPKILAAREMDIFPVEINYATYKNLIRAPGIGPKSARKIMAIRKNKPFKKLEELQRIGVVVKRAEPYIKLDGNYQSALDNY
jgi:predicted DNA-binding helix-hairpin-helix protein